MYIGLTIEYFGLVTYILCTWLNSLKLIDIDHQPTNVHTDQQDLCVDQCPCYSSSMST